LKTDLDAKAYIDPEKSDEHKEKGNDLFKAGDFVAALKEFDESLKRNPENKNALANRSATYTKLMDPARALADAEKCT